MYGTDPALGGGEHTRILCMGQTQWGGGGEHIGILCMEQAQWWWGGMSILGYCVWDRPSGGGGRAYWEIVYGTDPALVLEGGVVYIRILGQTHWPHTQINYNDTSVIYEWQSVPSLPYAPILGTK